MNTVHFVGNLNQAIRAEKICSDEGELDVFNQRMTTVCERRVIFKRTCKERNSPDTEC